MEGAEESHNKSQKQPISVMNRIPDYLTEMFPNRGVGCKIHINCKYLKMNSVRKYLDFEVNGECKILHNENCHD